VSLIWTQSSCFRSSASCKRRWTSYKHHKQKNQLTEK